MTRRRANQGLLATAATLAGHKAHARPIYGGGASGAGGATTISTITLATWDGTNIGANSGFELGVVIPPNVLSGSTKITAYDSGNNPLTVQEDNRATNGSTGDRFVKVTSVLGTAPGAATTTVTIKVENGSPNTSNPITLANLLAQTIGGDTFEYLRTCTMPNGDVYTAKATDGLNGSSTWTYGSPQNRGVFRQGPYCTEWQVLVPFTKTGTPHPFLYCEFHISAYKANAGAWNNITNPITGVKVTAINRNGWTLVSSPTDLIYDMLDQVGASSLSTVLQLNGSTPATTLTLGATTGFVTAVRSAGTWGAANMTTPNSQDIGKALVEIGGSGGTAWITGYDSTTGVRVQINNAFASTSKTSGQWKTMGVYHPYATNVSNYFSGHGDPLVCWWGTAQKVVAAMPAADMIKSQMFMNYGANATSVGTLALFTDQGSHPCAINQINGNVQGYGLQETSTGDADHIGVLSLTQTSALLAWDWSVGQHLNARTLMMYYGHVGHFKPYALYDETHGGVVSQDAAGGSFYYAVAAQNGIAILQPGSTAYQFGFALNHSGGCGYAPYLVSGDLIWLEDLAFQNTSYTQQVTNSGIVSPTSVTLANGSASITMPLGYPQETGEAILLDWGGLTPQIGGINVSRNNQYFVAVVDTTHVNLYDTRAHALAGGVTGLITFSSAGSGTDFINGYCKSYIVANANSNNDRAVAWGCRTAWQHAACVPNDTTRASLVDYSRTKSRVQRKADSLSNYLYNTYATNVSFQANGPRWLTQVQYPTTTGNAALIVPWFSNYCRLANINGLEAGVLNANGVTYNDWFLADSIEWIARTSDSSPYFIPFQYRVRVQDNSGTIYYTYAGVYQQQMFIAINISQSGAYTPTGMTASISSVANQAAVTITFSASLFDYPTNASKYVGAWVIVGSGCGQITSVTGATTCVVDSTVSTWDGTNPANASFSTGSGQAIFVGPAWPTNATSLASGPITYTTGDENYAWLANSGKEIAQQRGVNNTNYATAVSFMTGFGLPANPVSNAVANACASAIKANVVHR